MHVVSPAGEVREAKNAGTPILQRGYTFSPAFQLRPEAALFVMHGAGNRWACSGIRLLFQRSERLRAPGGVGLGALCLLATRFGHPLHEHCAWM